MYPGDRVGKIVATLQPNRRTDVRASLKLETEYWKEDALIGGGVEEVPGDFWQETGTVGNVWRSRLTPKRNYPSIRIFATRRSCVTVGSYLQTVPDLSMIPATRFRQLDSGMLRFRSMGRKGGNVQNHHLKVQAAMRNGTLGLIDFKVSDLCSTPTLSDLSRLECSPIRKSCVGQPRYPQGE